MSSTPEVLERPVDLMIASDTFTKGKLSYNIGLSNSMWQDYQEEKMLAELKAKGLIGSCWYILQHYNFLFGHPIPTQGLTAEKQTLFTERLAIIVKYVESHPKSMVADVYKKVTEELGAIEWNFFMFTQREWGLWNHLCYMAMSHAFFDIYEIIFDSRKGEQSLPFDLSEMLESLQGGRNTPNFEGMEAVGIWIEPIQSVWESIPVSNKSKNLRAALMDFPIFLTTVSQRNKFDGHAVEYLVQMCDRRDFCSFFREGFV